MMMEGIFGIEIAKALYELDELEAYLGVSENYLHKAKADFIAWADQ